MCRDKCVGRSRFPLHTDQFWPLAIDWLLGLGIYLAVYLPGLGFHWIAQLIDLARWIERLTALLVERLIVRLAELLSELLAELLAELLIEGLIEALIGIC